MSASGGRRATPRILFAANSLIGGNGIAGVARLMAKVLMEQQAAGRLRLHCLTLADRQPPPGLDGPVESARGSRALFALRAVRRSLGSSHVIYDAASMAQVHCLPLLRRKPALMYIHGIEVWEHAQPGHVRAARRMTMLLSNSDFTRQKADQLHGGFLRARRCWLAAEGDALPAAGEPLERRPPNVLIVGRMVEDRPKGHRELIACWPQVVAAVPGTTLHVVGGGPHAAALRELAARSPAAERIAFHGFVGDAQLAEHFARARVFAMPSRGEGFGLVYAEAMRHGLPVVASVHDAAAEVVLDGKTGYLIDLDQPAELPDRLIGLLRDPSHAQNLGDAGQRRWSEQFCYNAFRKRFLALLDEFLASSASLGSA